MEAGGALFKANNCGMAFFLFFFLFFFYKTIYPVCLFIYYFIYTNLTNALQM